MNPIWVFVTLISILVFIPVSLYGLTQFFRRMALKGLPYAYTENEVFLSFVSMAVAVAVWIAVWIFFWTVCFKYLPIN